MMVISIEEMLTYLLAGMLPVLKIGWDLVIRDELISWFVETISVAILIGLVGRKFARKIWRLLEVVWAMYQLADFIKIK